MVSDLGRTAYRAAWWALVLRGVLAIAVAVLIFWRPLESIASFALVIAIWALFTGSVQVVHAIGLRHLFGNWWVLFLSGLVSVVFGIAALKYYPGLSLAFAVAWVAWWLFLTGGLAIFAATVERRLGLSWGWTLAFGIVSVFAGAYALMAPPATLAAILGLIAGFALVSGVTHLMGAFMLSSAKAEIGSALHGAGAS